MSEQDETQFGTEGLVDVRDLSIILETGSPKPTSPAEPLEGITDAILCAQCFLDYARAHRDAPENVKYLAFTWEYQRRLLGKLQALK